MRRNRLRYEGQQMPLLLPTTRTHRQDPFNKTVPFRAVRSKTALPPDHCSTQRLFGCVIGRLDPLFAHERPQRLFVREQFLTQLFWRITSPRSSHEQHVERRLDRCHRLLESGSVNRAFAIQVPQPKYHVAQFHQIGSPYAQCPTTIDERLEVAPQMAPAQLVALNWLFEIGSMPIRGHNTAVALAKQL